MMISSGTFPEIARWWRRKQQSAGRGASSSQSLEEDNDAQQQRRKKQQQHKRPISNNPRTLLLSVTRSQDGLNFMRGRVRTLRKQLREDEDPQSRFLLALYLEKLGEDHLQEALREMDDALARMTPRTSTTSTTSSSSRCGGVNGWALSERSRLAKSIDSLLVRQTALTKARDSGKGTSFSPAVQCGLAGLEGPVRVGFCDGAPPATGGGRKRPRQVGDPGESNCHGNEESQPQPLSPSASPLGSCPTRFEAIDERAASTLRYEEFIETYALPGRPVVLKGGASLCFEEGCSWDRETLRKEAGDKVVPVRRWVPDSVSWARLDDAGRVPLERILGPPPSPTAAAAAPTSDTPKSHGGFGDRGIEHHATQSGHRNEQEREPLYLHDWSVPQNLGSDCSLLAGRFEVPKFFAGDMLQRLAGKGYPYTDSWPSLFVGPKGSKSDTHIDSFGSHFWMALLEGEKRWLIYPKEDAPLLYPIWPEGCHDPVFEAELDTPDAVRTPAVLLAKGACCVLEAGDLLFVPAGCPHRVENLTDTLALSCNYVDATNVDVSLKALQDQAFTDPGAGALASALDTCDRRLVRRQGEVPWAELKKWPREGEVADWLPQGTDGAPQAT